MSKQIKKRINLFPSLNKSIEAEPKIRTKPDHINDELFLRKRLNHRSRRQITQQKREQKGYKQLETLLKIRSQRPPTGLTHQ